MQNSNGEAFLALLASQEIPVECSEMNPDYWFADPNDEEEKYGRSERVIAQAVCGRCPIKHACFQYALDNDIQYGIWGGAVPAQRTAYRNKMNLYPKIEGRR